MFQIEALGGKGLNPGAIAHLLKPLSNVLGSLKLLSSTTLPMPQLGHEFLYEAEYLL